MVQYIQESEVSNFFSSGTAMPNFPFKLIVIQNVRSCMGTFKRYVTLPRGEGSHFAYPHPYCIKNGQNVT